MKSMKARDVMTTQIRTVGDDWSITRLTEYLVEHGISGAPVQNAEGRLVGVVSVTDIVRHDSLPEKDKARSQRTPEYYLDSLSDQYSGADLEGFDVRAYSDVRVADIMTPTVFEIDADSPVQKIADTLLTGRIHRLMVTENGSIVGLVTALDLLELIRGA